MCRMGLLQACRVLSPSRPGDAIRVARDYLFSDGFKMRLWMINGMSFADMERCLMLEVMQFSGKRDLLAIHAAGKIASMVLSYYRRLGGLAMDCLEKIACALDESA